MRNSEFVMRNRGRGNCSERCANEPSINNNADKARCHVYSLAAFQTGCRFAGEWRAL